jgi:hypothetical protein
VGLSQASENINAMDILPDGTIVVSTAGSVAVNAQYTSAEHGSGESIVGRSGDLLKFTPRTVGVNTTGTWSVMLRGDTMGIDAREGIDAVAVLSDGSIVISSPNDFIVPSIFARDEDLLLYSPVANRWSWYFDGSDVGLGDPGEDVDGLVVSSSSAGLPNLVLSTRREFATGNVAGEGADLFRFVPTQLGITTTGSFQSDLVLPAADVGLETLGIDGLHLGEAPIFVSGDRTTAARSAAVVSASGGLEAGMEASGTLDAGVAVRVAPTAPAQAVSRPVNTPVVDSALRRLMGSMRATHAQASAVVQVQQPSTASGRVAIDAALTDPSLLDDCSIL